MVSIPQQIFLFPGGNCIAVLWRTVAASGLLLYNTLAGSATLKDAEEHFQHGRYAECAKVCATAIEEGEFDMAWRLLLLQTRLATGQYPESASQAMNLLEDYRYRYNARALWLFHQAFQSDGQGEKAREMLQMISQFLEQGFRASRDEETIVYIGRGLLKLGADPRQVLENLYEPALKANPGFREALLAIGEMALWKNDHELASKTFRKALEKHSEDASFHYGMASAFAPSDSQRMAEQLEMALEVNPHHIPSLLLHMDHLIDAEAYGDANELLTKIFETNPWHPQAWAYQAVLHHLHSRIKEAGEARDKGLKHRPRNPEVDHLIGKKLSAKYRFSEGAGYQRRALEMTPDFVPAKTHLAQDLLRLGKEEEGWKLAEEAHDADGYDVAIFNLLTLHDTLKDFTTLERKGFQLRMNPEEAALYGTEALDLLAEARREFGEKYNVALEGTTLIEIFPDKKDFAVRTFGIPGGDGYMGVCFGRVITANSPKSLVSYGQNWQSLLWHEFCHVITLEKTSNKMPRWLSEGISVLEERNRHSAWGEKMTTEYRGMILDGEMSPIGKLSMAFIAPKSPEHVQFAYYQSSLVVEYLVENHGQETLNKILDDLGKGLFINVALEKQIGPMNELDKAFKAFAMQKAKAFGDGADLKTPNPLEVNVRDADAIAAWMEDNPDNIWALNQRASVLIKEKQFSTARPLLEKSLLLHPDQTGSNCAYALLAKLLGEQGETDREISVMTRWAEREAAALSLYERLMELHAERGEWEKTLHFATRYFSVNPLTTEAHQQLARSFLALGDRHAAILPLERLARLDPVDPARVHFQLAEVLAEKSVSRAKRHVVMALEHAPRYREAQQLLLTLSEREGEEQ